LHAVSFGAPSIVRQVKSGLHVMRPVEPLQFAQSSQVVPSPPGALGQSAGRLQHSAPFAQQIPSQCPL
jgi:hypothetical protein